MKYIFTLILASFLAILAGCNIVTNGINGNGNVVKQTRIVASFDKLKIDGVFKVFINQGNAESVVVEADDNLLRLIESNITDNQLNLNIKKDSSIGHSTKLNIFVTVKDIHELNVVGVNNVSCEDLNLNHLNLNIDGVGSSDLKLHCKTLNADLSGVGNLKLEGAADSAVLINSGVGSLKAYDFIVQHLDVTNSGVGNAEVNAEKEISINNSGVGSVKHKGNAAIKNSKNDGVGKIVKE